MDDEALAGLTIDGLMKGVPAGTPPTPVGAVAGLGWSVLAGDLPVPAAVLKASALDHNGRWMRAFLAASGASLAPHGKTTMAPQLFARQMADGAWGITLATVQQVAVARAFGVRRVVLANQPVDRGGAAALVAMLREDPGFDLYCLVDSAEGAAVLAAAARAGAPGRPVKLLLEMGVEGGRTGCRTVAGAMAVAAAVRDHGPHLALTGVEGFEGIIRGKDKGDTDARVAAFVDAIAEAARRLDAEGAFFPGEVILSAGGSAFYDIVAERLGAVRLSRPTRLVIRSGCYLTHDSALYGAAFARVLERSGTARGLGEGLRPALEVWSTVQSRPEPTRAIVAIGKRDASYDAGLPVALLFHRPGTAGPPTPIPPGHRAVDINDQHLYLDVPADSPLRIGDLVGFGISHPCLTFDKWQAMMLVDDDYRVTGAVRTFFLGFSPRRLEDAK